MWSRHVVTTGPRPRAADGDVVIPTCRPPFRPPSARAVAATGGRNSGSNAHPAPYKEGNQRRALRCPPPTARAFSGPPLTARRLEIVEAMLVATGEPTGTLLRAREVAALVGVSERQVARWAKAGMPHLKLPGRGAAPAMARFRAEEVDAWLDAYRVGDVPAAAPAPAKPGRPRRRVGGGAA